MFNPIPYVRAALGLFGSLSIQGAVSVSMGGALAYVGVLAGCSAVTVPLLLFAGMAIPLWPLRVYYSPDRVLTRKYSQWDRWIEKGYINSKKCKELKDGLYRWYLTQQPSPATAKKLPQPTHSFEVDEPTE